MERQGKSNYKSKIVSFVMACVIWVLVTYINDPVVTRRFSGVEVTVLNSEELEKKGYTYDIIQGKEISFAVKGNRRLVNSLDTSDFEVTADLKNLSIMDAVPIEVTARHDNNRLEITKSTDTMIISKDKGISLSIPVNAMERGTPQKGYALGGKIAKPNLIKVKGPKSVLIDAKEIRVYVDVSNATDDVTTKDKPKLYDEEGNVINSKQIEFDTYSVTVNASIWKTREIPVTVEPSGSPEDGYVLASFEYEPKKITVAAEDDIYDSLEKIDLGTISVDGLTRDHEEDIPVENLKLPEGVIAVGDVTDIKVKAEIEKKTNVDKTFKQTDIEIRNNKNQYKVEFDEDNEYKVTVFGAKSQVDQLDAGAFKPWIDLSGLGPGHHDLKLHVRDPEDVSIEETYRIGITLKE